jgi:hypothetical protein
VSNSFLKWRHFLQITNLLRAAPRGKTGLFSEAVTFQQEGSVLSGQVGEQVLVRGAAHGRKPVAIETRVSSNFKTGTLSP